MQHQATAILFLAFCLSTSVQAAETLKCDDTSARHVSAEIRSFDVLDTDKTAKEILTAKNGYSSPVIQSCSIKRAGENTIVVQTKWNDGILSVSGYDALSSHISFAYGSAENQPLVADLHLDVYVKAASEITYRRLLDATLGKEKTTSHSMDVRYLHEQTPNQRQDILLIWNTAIQPEGNQPLNVLEIRYQYDGVVTQPPAHSP